MPEPPHSPFAERLDAWLAALALLGHRRPWATLAVVAVLVGVSLAGASRLGLDTDLTSTLPEGHPSVTALAEMEERFGGVGSLTVVGQGIAPDRLHAFAEDLAPKLEAIPEIRWVDVRRPTQFFEDHALYYLAPQELADLVGRVEDRIAWERRQQNPMIIDLEESEPPALGLEGLEGKAHSGSSAWIRRMSGDPWYTDPARGVVAVIAKPAGRASDLDYARAVVAPVRELVSGLDMQQWGPEARAGLTGRFAKRVDQQRQITGDLQLASLVALAAMLAYLALHFRRVRAVALVVVPLLVGLTWMFGLAGFAFGQLNILTAFVGVILLGLGIDHGIHLLGRYELERATGAAREAAVHTAFRTTGRAVLVAALTTAGALASLAISEFRAFREFGLLSAFGIVAIVVAYGVCLPALLALLGAGGTEVSLRTRARSELARALPRWSPVLLWAGVAGLALAIANMGAVRFEQSFRALESRELPSARLDREVNRLLGYSQTPLVVMTRDEQDAHEVARRLMEQKRERGEASTVDFAATVADLVPPEQQAKRAELDRLEGALDRVKPGWLEPADRERLEKLQRMAAARPFGVQGLPEEILRQFRRPDGTLDRGFVLVFSSVDQGHGEAVRRLSDEIRGAVAGVPGATVAGEPLVLAEVLEVIEEEAPRMLAIAAVAAVLVMWLLLGSFGATLLGLGPAVATVLATFGLLPLVGAELNYLNVVMLPALLGMSLDGGLHVVVQRRAGAEVSAIVGETGRGIAGSILTTALGFGALLVTRHDGLASIAHLVLMGLAVNVLVCLVVLPALLAARGRRVPKKPRGGRLAQEVATVGLLGLSPVAPGTFGAIVALPTAWLLRGAPWWLWAGVLAVGTAASIWVVDRYIALCKRGDDPQEVVLDELLGCLIALAFVPWSPLWVLLAFGLFRLFDIWKPGPIRALHDKLHGGLGVMGDDVLAGLMAGGLLAGLRVFA